MGGEPQIKKPVQDLWRELHDLASQHTIRWTWIADHGHHDLQNRCDALVVAAARRQGGC